MHTVVHGTTIMHYIMASILAVVVEGGKLFVPSKHPDPTALLIAAVGATFGFRLANYLFNWSLGARTAPSPVQAKAGSSDTTTRSARRHKAGALVAACLMLIGVGVAVANYPLSGPWLWIALTLYGLCIW